MRERDECRREKALMNSHLCVCMRACACACVRTCVRACVRVCVRMSLQERGVHEGVAP